MSSFYTVLLIGLSLSMDAFSLALVYGMIGITNKKKLILSIIVGLFHFIMPLIGLTLGIFIDRISFINLHLIAAIILIYIGIDLIISNLKATKTSSLSIMGLLMFSLSVSIDSLTIGIGLKAITDEYLVSAITFSICSFILTYIGLILGNIVGNKIGIYSKMVGGIILIIIAILMIL